MSALATNLVNRAGTIRRVVRVGRRQVCGLCRQAYKDFARAQACVDRCWEELLTLSPVIVRPGCYRCRFCARDHLSRDVASKCAEECRTKQLTLLRIEHDLEEDDDGPRPQRHRPAKARAMQVAPVARPLTRPTADPTSTAPDVASPAGGPNPISVDVGQEVATGAGGVDRSDDDP